jgi:hypothetical protein
MSTTIANQCPGFSDRFNQLLDKAAFPAMGVGRAKALSDQFGGSKSGAQNWVGKDMPPKRDTLREVVEQILNDMQAPYDVMKVIAWLEYGEAVYNPFDDTIPLTSGSIPVASNHAILSKVYVAVHRIAKEMKFDIYAMEDDTIDYIYNAVLRKALDSNTTEPDEYLIKTLLKFAAKNTA